MKSEGDEAHSNERALEAYLERSRADLAGSVSDEDLLAFHRGELDAEAREHVLEHISLDPETATRYEELSAYPDSAEPGDSHYLSDLELENHWQRFSARLAARNRAASDELPAARASPGEILVVAEGDHRGAPAGSGEEKADRTSAPSTVVFSDRQPLVLTLVVPRLARREGPPMANENAPEGAADRLSLEIWPRAGRKPRGSKPIWRRHGMQPSPAGHLELSIPAGFLAPGAYEIELARIDSGTRDLLALYRLAVE